MPRGFPHGVPFRKMGRPWKRLNLLRTLVNALITHERIETTFPKAHETQKYVERLIDIAKYGPSSKYCNDMLEYWTPEESQKTKLFDVLVPRYSEHKKNYTRLAILPSFTTPSYNYSGKMAVLELKGNPLPPLPIKEKNPHTLQNVLIAAAKEEWEQKKLHERTKQPMKSTGQADENVDD